MTRRGFLAAPAAMAAAGGRGIRLGGPVFLKSGDPREVAREHRKMGYSAAFCPAVKLDDAARIAEIQKAYAAEDVIIAEVGAWKNMLDPDEGTRRANLKYVTERMALAEAVGARCCVDIAGSYHPKIWYGPHPKNVGKEFFDATVENCRRVIDDVKPKRTKFTLEMMGWALPDGPEEYLRLVRAVDRAGFAVHLDVCNAINSPRRYYGSAAFIADCFRILGKWIVSCHAKDLEWNVEMNVRFTEVVPGRGQVDYGAYLRELSKLPAAPPLMMEHLKSPAEYEEGKQYIQKVAAANGLKFA